MTKKITRPPGDRSAQSVLFPQGRRDALRALALFGALFAVYLSNGDFLPSSDAAATTYQPVHVIERGSFTFTPEAAPYLFKPRQPGQAAQKRGSYIVPTTTEGVYANTFGFGTTVTALPAYLVAKGVWGQELAARHDVVWHTAKVAASAMAAGSAAFVFLAARRFTGWRGALFVGAVYGVGSCVWTLSSQALWQHPANELFLAMGTWLFVRGWPSGGSEPPILSQRAWLIAAGLAWSWAVACRPTSLLVLLGAAVGLAFFHRRLVWALVLGALPVGIVIAIYNAMLFGSPIRFGQTVHTATATEYLVRKGADSPWTWALWDGAAGLLLSPSRGLFIYSPVFVLALWGMVTIFREARWRPLRGLVGAVLVLWLVAFAWFDWWGGWSFGYRPILDTLPLLALFLVPVLPNVTATPVRRVGLGLLVVASVAVQVLGAFTYNGRGWNHGAIYEVRGGDGQTEWTDRSDQLEEWLEAGGHVSRVVSRNVDLPQHRHRLWSLTDSQLFYYAGSLAHSRDVKRRDQAAWLKRFAADP